MAPASTFVVLVTAPIGRASRTLADEMVRRRVAACVNIVPRVRSVYRWNGKVETAPECLLVMKTRRGRVKALIQAVRALHPYKIPEVLALPVQDGFEPYLKWVRAETEPVPVKRRSRRL